MNDEKKLIFAALLEAHCTGASGRDSPYEDLAGRLADRLASLRQVPEVLVKANDEIGNCPLRSPARSIAIRQFQALAGEYVRRLIDEANPDPPTSGDDAAMRALEAYARGVNDGRSGMHGFISDEQPVMYQQIHRHHPNAKWTECDKATFDQYSDYHRQYGGNPPVRALYAHPPKAAPAQAGALPNVPANCRQRLCAEGKPYPRSSCQVCGKFSPRWRDCDVVLAAEDLARRGGS